MKYTPGPWLRSDNLVYTLMHSGWKHGVEQFQNRVTFAGHADQLVPDEEFDGDLRLVHAAPQMYEALCKLEAYFKGDVEEHDSLVDDVLDVLDNIRGTQRGDENV